MASIYVITNDVNGKQYVGKTLFSIKRRFREHIITARRRSFEKRPLYEAIRKYGEKHFSIRPLEENIDPEKLSEREIFWIKELGTYGHKGYNMTLGGDGKQFIDYKEIEKLALQGMSNIEIADILGCCAATVTNVRGLLGLKRGSDLLKKPIDQLDLSGNFLRTFDSLANSVKWLIDNHYTSNERAGQNLGYCLKGKKDHVYGFKWRYHNESDRPSH